MADNEHADPADAPTIFDDEPVDVDVVDDEEASEEKEPERLNLDVDINERSTCERHITITIPREDIDRFFDKEFSELVPKAQVPGFRPGHAPRKLIEKRFRQDVGERVKSELLVASLEQIHEEHELSAISEPQIDLDAIEMPDEGPLTYEFDLEVRPQFDLPQWKGLTIEQPVHDITQEDVDRTLENMLAQRGRLVPHDGAAEPGDYITTNLTFKQGDRVLSSAEEEVIRLRPVLSFRDGRIEGFDRLMEGVQADETRTCEATLSQDAPNAALRGQTVTAVFDVLEVKKLQLPELDEDLLDELGGFELEADLRDAIKDQLERQLEYEQHQRVREQITRALTVAADWELPPDLLRRQAQRERQRAKLELSRAGFSEDEIRAHENEIRQNSAATTARALREHFILERIAEEEEIDVEEEDYTQEIALIARQTGESPRRVRAKLEKSESMDVLRNQIIERKVIERILEHAEFRQVPFEFERPEVEALDQAAGGHGAEIPDAKAEAGAPAEGGRPAERPWHE
jgi:trigger factor